MQHPTAHPSSIIVGIIPGQPDRVIEKACEMAASMAPVKLHLVYVDPTLVKEGGHIEPLDPDSMGVTECDNSKQLSEHAIKIARGAGADADYHLLVGDPVKELAEFAREHDAVMIVVGTRERGALAALQEWVNGSVSVRLAHTQHIVVLTVPLADEYDD